MHLFVPSPSSGNLGGVTSKTKDIIVLCEAAGFDIILVETVGVGQSETTVSNICDFFLLLMLSGAGDELQGIKRGIMEIADMLVITKAEGNNLHQKKNAKKEYQRALHLFPCKWKMDGLQKFLFVLLKKILEFQKFGKRLVVLMIK